MRPDKPWDADPGCVCGAGAPCNYNELGGIESRISQVTIKDGRDAGVLPEAEFCILPVAPCYVQAAAPPAQYDGTDHAHATEGVRIGSSCSDRCH